jgi:Uma2 family endonuclease
MSVADFAAPARLGPESNGILMTAEEFDAVEDWDDSYCYELVNGVVIVNPPAGFGETNPNDELGFWLRTYRDSSPHGARLDGTTFELTVRTPKGRRRADRVIWVGLGRDPVPGRDVPAIVVEFVSKTSRDRKRDHVAKREEYAEAGVQEYWVIDHFQRIMTVYRGNQVVRIVRESETWTTDLLPGFELPLGLLLEVADRSIEE